jgi:hypothetical protein
LLCRWGPPKPFFRNLLEAIFVSRLFGTSFRKAKRFFWQISKDRKRKPRGEMIGALRDLRDFLGRVQTFETNASYHSVLGVHFVGLDSDFAALQRLIEWYRQVREAFPFDRPSAKAFRISLFRSQRQRLEALTKLSETRAAVREELDYFAADPSSFNKALQASAVGTVYEDLAKLAVELRRVIGFLRELLSTLAGLHARDDCSISSFGPALKRLEAHEQKRGELEITQHRPHLGADSRV